MPTWNFHGNLPTVLVYTWICSRHDLRAAVLPARNDALRRKNGEEVVRLLVEQEVALVEPESLHGRLLRLETSTIDLFTIDATLRESSGIYFNASQEEQRLEYQREEEGSDLQSQATGIVTDWLELSLPRFGGVEKRGIYSTEGGEYAKATEDLHPGVQTGSRAARQEQRQADEPNSTGAGDQ